MDFEIFQYKEVTSDSKAPQSLLQFNASDFKREKEDPGFVLRGRVVANPAYIDSKVEEFKAETAIAQLGRDELGLFCWWDARARIWRMTDASKFQIMERKRVTQAAASSTPKPPVRDHTSALPGTGVFNPLPLSRPLPVPIWSRFNPLSEIFSWNTIASWKHAKFPRVRVDIPELIEREAIKIAMLPRTITGMPMRQFLRAPPFRLNFSMNSGVLQAGSPLHAYSGDLRLFPMDVWIYLSSATVVSQRTQLSPAHAGGL